MAKILVAEDDAHVIRLMTIWLTKSGHEVFEARNGDEAKAHLLAENVDLVVTDINMPHCDGIQLVEWMRHEQNLQQPVTMLSARCDQARIGEKLADLNVSIHPKPFSPSRLAVEIEAKLSTAGAPASEDV